jgi:hypothetical protein
MINTMNHSGINNGGSSNSGLTPQASPSHAVVGSMAAALLRANANSGGSLSLSSSALASGMK